MSDLKNYLPNRLKKTNQTFNQALIQGINENSTKLLELIQACIDQFFLTTASGKYLVQLGEQQGFVMPANSGLDIQAYRVLVPLMVSAPKQIRRTFEEAVEAFYTSSKTRASITATVYEPYSLVNGDDLHIETEKGLVKVAFLSGAVSDLSSVTASELAAVINSSQTNVFADSIADRTTGRNYLRIMCTTIGASAYIKIVGGTAQNIMKFPNFVDTAADATTQWEMSKPQPYSDLMTIKWVGGTNPQLYKLTKGDCVTIRGLSDYLLGDVSLITGSEENAATIMSEHPTNEVGDLYIAEDSGHAWVWQGTFFSDEGVVPSAIQGSYQILDSGYDFFTIRNTSYPITFCSFTQGVDNAIFFTSQDQVTLYDNAEYGMVSEIVDNEITVTIPAIPPLAKRFLSGSAHLHNTPLDVLSFSRNSITVARPSDVDKPVGENLFTIKNNRMRYDFSKFFYKTISCDDSVDPNYSVVSNEEKQSVLPFTTPMIIGDNPFHCEVDSNEVTITFDYPHGLLNNWGMTLSDVDSLSNLTSDILNREVIVLKTISPYIIVYKMYYSSGDNIGLPVLFEGVSFGTFDLYRYTSKSDGADFYLSFPDEASVIASGLQVNQTFKLVNDSGTIVNLFYANALRHKKLIVKAIDGNIVKILTGFGVGPTGLIMSGASGRRSADFGGSAPKYHFDQTSTWNVANVMNGLEACFCNYTQSTNPEYVSSYLYDPAGVQTMHTVSKYITSSSQTILKGSNPGLIFVDKVSNLDGDLTFPTSGTLILDYGTNATEGPISYFATIDGGDFSTSQIIIDPSYKFQKTHDAGAQVQFVHASNPYSPGITGEDYPVYVTGSAQARNTLYTLLEQLVAGGIKVGRNTLLPQLKYDDPAIPPFE